MINLKEAFSEGMNLARVSDVNHKEIDGVIETVRRELFDFTNGKVELRLRRAKPNEIDLSASARYGGITQIIELVGNSEIFGIGKLMRGDLGYPCYLFFPGHTLQIADRDALGSAFSDLFKTYAVGSILFKLSEK